MDHASRTKARLVVVVLMCLNTLNRLRAKVPDPLLFPEFQGSTHG